MNQTTPITFLPLQQEHLQLLHTWLNEPHVQQWWGDNSHRIISLENIRAKLSPRIQGQEKIHSFIAYLKNQPFGYIQVYDARAFPREGYHLQQLDTYLHTITKLAAVDLYIGDSLFLGKGYGTHMLNTFLEQHVAPYYTACIADPDIINTASIKCFKKCGFIHIHTLHLKDEKVAIMLKNM